MAIGIHCKGVPKPAPTTFIKVDMVILHHGRTWEMDYVYLPSDTPAKEIHEKAETQMWIELHEDKDQSVEYVRVLHYDPDDHYDGSGTLLDYRQEEPKWKMD